MTTRFLKDQLEDTLQHWNNSLMLNIYKTTPSLDSPKANVLYKEGQSDSSTFKLPTQDDNIISACDLVEISIDYSFYLHFILLHNYGKVTCVKISISRV